MFTRMEKDVSTKKMLLSILPSTPNTNMESVNQLVAKACDIQLAYAQNELGRYLKLPEHILLGMIARCMAWYVKLYTK
jgi:hypothetical protein